MESEHFRELFESALERAVAMAERQLGRALPRNLIIELHGAGYPGIVMSPTTAGEALYINDEQFYRVIDVAVKRVSAETVTLFVRASDHPPSPYDKTWDPSDLGPFQPVIPLRIEQEP